MNKAFDKILDRLEGKIKCEEQNAIKANKANTEETINLVTAICAFADRYRSAKEIVQEVAEEYNITNGDKIRSMSDEELAEFLCRVKADYQWVDPEYPSEEEVGEWEEWLQSETE